MKVEFYGYPLSPFSMRVLMQVRLKGVPIPMEPPPRGLASYEYRAINPLGKIPALVVDGKRIPESEVICELLEDLFPEHPLRPVDPLERARCRVLSRVVDLYVMNPMLPLFSHLNPARRDLNAVERILDDIKWGLGRLDAFVSPGPYALGEEVSLADCAAVPVLYYVERFLPMFGETDPLSPHPNLDAYWAHVRAQPWAAQILEEMASALAAH